MLLIFWVDVLISVLLSVCMWVSVSVCVSVVSDALKWVHILTVLLLFLPSME